MTRRPHAARSVLCAAVAATLLLGCTAPAPAPPAATARAVTSEEAQLIALARFANFDAGARPFQVTVEEAGAALELRGWVDYTTHLGYAAVAGDFDPQALLWTATTVGIIPASPDAQGDPPLPIPALDDTAWQSRPLDTSGSQLDAVLATIGNLGSDRPENPLLVQQSGALWLRDDDVAGTPVTVFAAPPSEEPATGGLPTAEESALRLWIDADGLVLRAELRLGTEWLVIELPARDAPRLELPGGEG